MQTVKAKKKGSVDTDTDPDSTVQMELDMPDNGNGNERAEIDPALLPDLRGILLPGVVVPISVNDLFIDHALSGRLGGRNPQKFAETKASIKDVGQLEPVGIGLMDDGKGILYSGFGRARAIQELFEEGHGDGYVLCTLWDKSIIDGYLSGIASNTKREDLNPVQMGGIIQNLSAPPFKMKQKEIGLRLGITQPHVSDILKILKLPDDIQVAIQEGQIGTMAAMAYARNPEEGAKIARKQLKDSIALGKSSVPASEARTAMQEATGSGIQSAKQIKTIMEELLNLNTDENTYLGEREISLLRLLHNFADGYVSTQKVKKVIKEGGSHTLIVKKHNKRSGPVATKKKGKKKKNKRVAAMNAEETAGTGESAGTAE